jgi:hypothetical protein
VEKRLGSAGRHSEIGDFGGAGYATWSSVVDGCVWFLKAVLDEQMQVVPLIEDLALDVGVELSQLANLPVLLGDELLAHRGYLNVDIVFREVEVRAEMLQCFAIRVPFDGERLRLVLPVNLVKIEKSREFPLAVVSEIGGLRLRWRE